MYLKFNEVWENPLFIGSILESEIHVMIELSLQGSFWDNNNNYNNFIYIALVSSA